jgi:integrase
VIHFTQAAKSRKPKARFPFFQHATGRWAKKRNGKTCYYGYVKDDPKGETALLLLADDLAGRERRANSDGPTVGELCNAFLASKEKQRDNHELAAVTFNDYYRTCRILVKKFGKSRTVESLRASDFEELRDALAKQYGVHRLGNTVQRIRSVFKYGHEAELLNKPVVFGPAFKRPSARKKRHHRQQSGRRMFEAHELRAIISAAGQPLKAMIFLGISCGFGNADCGKLPRSAVNFQSGWINFPRPKTAVERRCPLWPETIEALRIATASRPAPKDPADAVFVFLTKYGRCWAKDRDDNPIAKEFTKLLKAMDAQAEKDAKQLGVKAPEKLRRPGLGFYALRHTFETIGGESKDQVAVNHIMGHADSSMAAVYREHISDGRLLAVTNFVRAWLFPDNQTARPQ